MLASTCPSNPFRSAWWMPQVWCSPEGRLPLTLIRSLCSSRSLPPKFRDQLAEAGQTDLAKSVMADMFIPIHKALCEATVALSFAATLDDAGRFRRAKDVGAFLGPIQRRHQSGDVDWSGRISKCGDRDLWRLLYSAATTLITQVRRRQRRLRREPDPRRTQKPVLDLPANREPV